MSMVTETEFPKFITKIAKELNYEFNSEYAQMFGIMINDGINFKTQMIEQGRDIYELLDASNIDLLVMASQYDYITVGTCGWAAPINSFNNDDNDLAPSQHPERTRVKVLVTSNVKQLGSSVMFLDKKDDEPVNDFGNARGELADSFNTFVEESFKFKQ